MSGHPIRGMWRTAVFLFFLLSIPGIVRGQVRVPPEDARAVIATWARTPHEPRPFTQWLKDVWAFNAIHCAAAAGVDTPMSLKNYRPSQSTVWARPGDSVAACRALAHGGMLECGDAVPTEPALASRVQSIPSAYLIAARPIAERQPLQVQMPCVLRKGYGVTYQVYRGPATVHWVEPPRKQLLSVPTGVLDVYVGTISLEVAGYPLPVFKQVLFP